MTKPTISDWDIEHGWYALRLFEQRHSYAEIAIMMQTDQAFIKRYLRTFALYPDLKAELLARAAVRWPADFGVAEPSIHY
jgi:hypothetical protein